MSGVTFPIVIRNIETGLEKSFEELAHVAEFLKDKVADEWHGWQAVGPLPQVAVPAEVVQSEVSDPASFIPTGGEVVEDMLAQIQEQASSHTALKQEMQDAGVEFTAPTETVVMPDVVVAHEQAAPETSPVSTTEPVAAVEPQPAAPAVEIAPVAEVTATQPEVVAEPSATPAAESKPAEAPIETPVESGPAATPEQVSTADAQSAAPAVDAATQPVADSTQPIQPAGDSAAAEVAPGA